MSLVLRGIGLRDKAWSQLLVNWSTHQGRYMKIGVLDVSQGGLWWRNELQYSLPYRWTNLELTGAHFLLGAQLAPFFLPPYCSPQFPHSQMWWWLGYTHDKITNSFLINHVASFSHQLTLKLFFVYSVIFNNPRGNDLVLAPYTIVLILCTYELKRSKHYLVI